ncbi:MAG: hypothetical protein ACRDF4_11535 [Rhabdochlamydiaceae bacterium]
MQFQSRLLPLSEMHEKDKIGCVCVKILDIGPPKTSRKNWAFRKLVVEDGSMESEMLIGEDKFSEWSFRTGDYVACTVKSWGMGKTVL